MGQAPIIPLRYLAPVQIRSLINKREYICVAERDRQGFSDETLASPPCA